MAEKCAVCLAPLIRVEGEGNPEGNLMHRSRKNYDGHTPVLAEWYRPDGMGYSVYIPANKNEFSTIVMGAADYWVWCTRNGSRIIQESERYPSEMRVQAAVESRYSSGGHFIIAVMNTEQPPGPRPLDYHCGYCGQHVWWDGVFEGRWFHDNEGV